MAVYLEDTILPKKLDFLINEIQAVTKPEKIEVHFYHQIERAFSGSDIKTPVKRNQENALSRDLIEKYNMVLVKSGTFQMGSNDGDDRNKPVHTVTVSDFYIGKYEVTQAQWQAVMGTNPSKNQKGGNYPVGTVSWNDCQKFIKKLNQQTGEKFRLPTEAEWEYAAIGGDQSRAYTYSGSNTLDDVAWYRNNSDYHTHPIGQKKPNELGLHDMSGNVWEWCQDWYAADYYQHSPQNNPSGPKTGSGRVLRGGSFFVNTEDLRCSIRLNYGPDLRNGSIGFRLVRAL
ncbi:formylglycine-generating enzyme family protein [bacterium]|nr:formylglycine-generating enzyme family protein [bacterium]